MVDPSPLPSLGLVPCDQAVRISSSSTVREIEAPVRMGNRLKFDLERSFAQIDVVTVTVGGNDEGRKIEAMW